MIQVAGQIRILLADGHSLFRDALGAVLAGEGDLLIVGEACDGNEALAEAGEKRPDVALLDADLAGFDGFTVTSQLKELVSDCRTIVLSGTTEERNLVKAVEAGAAGFLRKDSPLTDLIEATRAVHRGDTVIPAGMLGPLLDVLVERRKKQSQASTVIATLTRREREVLGFLAVGSDNTSIARQLFISPETARTHIQNILGKLGVHSRLEAAAFVLQNNVLDELEAQLSPVAS